MKKTSIIIAGLATASLVAAPPAWGAEDATLTTTIKNHADNGHPSPNHWADDTFTRTTKIHDNGDGTYEVTFSSKGTFRTIKGAKNPNGNGESIKRRVTGDFTEQLTATVTGKLRGKNALNNLNGNVYNDKNNTTRKTTWQILRPFKPGAKDQITSYTYTYQTPCEKWVDSSTNNDGKGEQAGSIVGKKCATPFVASVLDVKAKCRWSKTDKRQVWTVTNVAGGRDRDFWAWVGSPNPHPGQKYHEGNSWGFLHLFDTNGHGYFNVKPGETKTIVTGWGGGLAVHWWSGDSKPMRAWVYSDHRVTCK